MNSCHQLSIFRFFNPSLRVLLQQTQIVGSTAPLVENMAWRGNSTLNSYTATRTGTGAWNESRAYAYDSRGQLLSEGFTLPSSPSPLASSLNYSFDGTNPGLGIRTDAKIGTGAPASWETIATSNTLGQVTTDNQVTTPGQVVPATGTVSSAGSVNISVDGILQGLANFSGGTWSINLDLAAGSHTLTAAAVDPSGLSTATASSTFTVTSALSASSAVNSGSGTVTSAYDADGNVIGRSWDSGVTQTLTWDAFDRLLQVSQRDSSQNGYDWTAIYDGLGRRISTTNQPVVNNVANGAPTVTASIYDPQVEFLEIGVSVNGAKAWKVYGPDLNGTYGGMQGTGGLEATIMDSTGAATGVINDYFGNGVATISGGSVTWSPTKVGGYGPLPDSTATPLTDATQLAQSTVWRGHRIDPTGFYYLGARYYEPVSGRFLSPDPKGQAASMSLYDFCNGDPVNSFDSDGRCGLKLDPNFEDYADNGVGPGHGTNISNNDPTTGGRNPSGSNNPGWKGVPYVNSNLYADLTVTNGGVIQKDANRDGIPYTFLGNDVLMRVDVHSFDGSTPSASDIRINQTIVSHSVQTGGTDRPQPQNVLDGGGDWWTGKDWGRDSSGYQLACHRTKDSNVYPSVSTNGNTLSFNFGDTPGIPLTADRIPAANTAQFHTDVYDSKGTLLATQSWGIGIHVNPGTAKISFHKP